MSLLKFELDLRGLSSAERESKFNEIRAAADFGPTVTSKEGVFTCHFDESFDLDSLSTATRKLLHRLP